MLKRLQPFFLLNRVLRFFLYSRSYCHLCDDMRAAFVALDLQIRYELEVVDIDADTAALALYDELVPVLVGLNANGQPRQLCHYFLDETAVRDFVADVAGSTQADV